MNYIYRELERKFMSMSDAFKVVMVTGARQVGKSTMLKHLAEGQNRTYVTMDNAKDRELAETDPELFFQVYRPPVLIDEAQKAPALFETIKIMCDESDERGRFWLTGSQSRRLMKEAGDTLAGRICVLKMYSLSQREKAGRIRTESIDFALEKLLEREHDLKENNVLEVFDHIWSGGMPDMLNMDSEQSAEYWNSYVETYLMRDAVDDNGVTDTVGFRKFLRACAAFTGSVVNYTDIARAAGTTSVTAKAWMKILQSMGVIYLLEPYFSNELKRLTKAPKLYFCDTGLCAYLSSWTSRDALMRGAVSGHYFENYVVGELLRSYSHDKSPAQFSYYRDSNQKEIDLIIEQDNVLHPLEIKKSASPDAKAIKTFNVLNKTGKEIGSGGIVCMTGKVRPIDRNNCFIPAGTI